MKRLSAIILAIILLVGVLPLGEIFSFAQNTAVSTTWGGGFEGGTFGKTPDGWTIDSTDSDGVKVTTTDYKDRYVLTYSDIAKNGNRSVKLAGKNGGKTQGYIGVNSEELKVSANTVYTLKFSLKLENVETNPPEEPRKNFLGTRPALIQYDKDGNVIKKEWICSYLLTNFHWQEFTATYKTDPNTASVKLFIYLGGRWNGNENFGLYIDDMSFTTLSDNDLVNGDFEEGTYGWSLSAKNMQNTPAVDHPEYANNYTLSSVNNGYHGKAVAVTRKSWGYVTLDSNMIKVTKNATYVLDYAVKIENSVYENFVGVGAWVAEYDANKNFIKRTNLSQYIRQDIDWTEQSYTLPISSAATYFQIEFFAGAGKDCYFTAYFDDVRISKVIRTTRKDTINNGDFESVLNKTVLDWTFSKREGTSFSSTFDGYNNTKGIVTKRENQTENNFSVMTSNAFEVTEGQKYKLSYMARIAKQEGNVYVVVHAVFIDANDKVIENQRVNIYDYISRSPDWTQVSGVYTAPKGAKKCKVQITTPGINFEVYYDDFKWEKHDETLDVYGFEKTDANGNILGWTTNSPVGTKVDNKVYREGTQSLFLSQTSNTQYANVYCDNLIPVNYETRYKFTIYIKSFDCNVNSNGIRLMVRKFDKNGKSLGKITGLRYTLNEDSTPSDWSELICGVYTGYDVAYVQPFLYIAPGTTNFWIDDLDWRVYDLNNEFYDNFDSVNSEGTPDGWQNVTVSGSPDFKTEDSITNIIAEKKDDIGYITAKWNTAQEYINVKFSTTYLASGNTDAKVTIKFYDIGHKEIVEDRIEKNLENTGGEFRDFDFEFFFSSAMYAMIELGNTDAGTVSFKGININQVKSAEEEYEEGDWRGKWIWYPEDYYNAQNLKRYFRFHTNIPKAVTEGTLQITADDEIKVWINGTEITLDDAATDWTSVSFIEELEKYFVVGDNVIAIEVQNFTSAAGLLFDGFVRSEDGERFDFYSTTATLSWHEEVEGWHEKDFNDKNWLTCQTIASVGATPWGEIAFDYSYFVENKFEIIDYTVTEVVNAGEEVQLTMTVIPEKDITSQFDLQMHLWKRNTQNKVLSITPELVSGTPMHEWKAGETYTVTYAFEMYDFIGAGRYVLQLDTNQVLITNMELMNNRLTKAVQVINDPTKNQIKSEMKEINGTQAFVINGDTYPVAIYSSRNGSVFFKSPSDAYMASAGITLTRVWANLGGESTSSYPACWLGDGIYDFSLMDAKVYDCLSSTPNTYLLLTFNMDVPKWWREQNPDELVKTSNPDKDGTGVSFSSDKFVKDASEANYALIEHMMQQPYWNRVVAACLSSCRTTEWLWYGNGPLANGYDKGSEINFRKFLEKKYGSDEKLQEAWNNKTVTIETAKVPTPEERVGTSSTIFLDPKTQKAGIDFAEYMQVRVADILNAFADKVTELTNDKIVLGAYYGYINVDYTQNAISTLHTGMEKVLENDNIDFFSAPFMYESRYDGEAGGIMQMVDSVLLHDKAVIVEDDNRLCSFIDVGSNFYTRDTVGPTYNVWDSISQLSRNFAMQIANNTGNWYLNLGGNYFERQKFSDLIAICRNEQMVNLSREKDDIGDVCYIIDEDMYENQSYDGFDNAYEFLYPLIAEQRLEFAKSGVMPDQYLMSDLRKGNVPDHKVYFMLSPVALNEEEREAIEDELKCDGKVIVWLYLAGASDDKTFSAENMAEVIGMDMKFDNTKRSLSAIVTNDNHWLTQGTKNQFFGNPLNKQINTPTAIITDKDATVLAGMNDNTSLPALSIKENGDWTSIYSAVPHLPVEIIRNIYKKCGIHIYSESTNDVIFHNSNYVGINCAYGGEKTIKLPGTYAVYDVYAGTTYSLSTDTIKITMGDNQTKLFRLTPADEHVVFVEILDSKAKSDEAGYNEVSPGEDFSTTIKAKKGYVISEIIIDGVKTEMREKEYSIDLEDVSNSHYIKANFKRVAGEEPEDDSFPMWIIYVGAGVVLFAAAFILFFLILKKKNKKEEEETQNE